MKLELENVSHFKNNLSILITLHPKDKVMFSSYFCFLFFFLKLCRIKVNMTDMNNY